jgi:hypothetical protein
LSFPPLAGAAGLMPFPGNTARTLQTFVGRVPCGSSCKYPHCALAPDELRRIDKTAPKGAAGGQHDPDMSTVNR